MQRSRSASVNFNGNNIAVTAKPRTVAGVGTMDTIGGVQNLNALYGVTVSLSTSATSVDYDPRGFAGGLSATPLVIVLSRSGKRDSVSLDYLGRVTK